MKNNKLLYLCDFLFNEYKERAFQPVNKFQKKMLYDMIKHDAERFDINDISNEDVEFIISQVKEYYKKETI